MSITDISVDPVSATHKMFSCSAAASSSSSNAQLRKIKKPMIERRRRERINECLGQLKALVLEATNKDESRYSKMEKADILEMTVAHLKFVHSARRSYVDVGRHAVDVPAVTASVADEPSSGPTALRYLMGYNECVREVASYLTSDVGEVGYLGDDVRASLMRHLDECLRLRAVAPVVVANRLPSPRHCGRFDVAAADIPRPSSSPTVDLVVDLAGATPWRHRCDSGVYSGASSPAQADDLSVAPALPSPLELTTPRIRKPTSTTIYRDVSPSHSRTPDVTMSTEVWRPW